MGYHFFFIYRIAVIDNLLVYRHQRPDVDRHISDWVAVTFLGLASTQFREIRKMERDSLENINMNELVKSGALFIERMAQAFESRNYVVMFTALVTTLCSVYSICLAL